MNLMDFKAGWGRSEQQLLGKGPILEWSDPSGFSQIVWWAGHVPMEKVAMNV